MQPEPNDPSDSDNSSKLRRFFLSWRGVVIMAILLSAAVFLFVKLQPPSEWERYQLEMAAKGESLDWKHFIPAPVSDEEKLLRRTRNEGDV